MKKSELLKMKPQYATPSMMRAAANDVPVQKKSVYRDNKYIDVYKNNSYIRGKYENGIVRIAIFLTENMRLGCNKPVFEIFIDTEKRDFITYDYKHKKWSNAKINVLPWNKYDDYLKHQSSREFNKFIKKYLNTEKTGFDGVLAWQWGVRDEQLKARHKKETDPWDAEMNKIPKEPVDWKRWVDKCGITHHYIFYQYVRGGAKTGYCSWCEQEVNIKNPKHNGIGRCSHCGHPIQYKSIGKAGSFTTDRESAYLMQKYGKGFVLREYTVFKRYHKGKYKTPEITAFEEVRVIFDSELHCERYYFGMYKQQNTRWIYNGKSLRYSYSWYYNTSYVGRVYGKTMPSLKKLLSRTGLIEMIQQLQKTDPEIYLAALQSKPYIEQLVKAGLTQLVYDIVFRRGADNDEFDFEKSKELGKALQIDKSRLKRLREHNGGTEFLKWLKFEKNRNKPIDDDVIRWFVSENIKPKDIEFILDRMSERQIKNYLIRQQKDIRRPAKEIISTWADYLKMAIRAKMNVNDEIVYRVKKLQQRHDELIQHLGSKDLAIQAGEIATKFPNVDRVCEEIKSKYEFADEKYAILVPKCIEDIISEGKTLHHCIASSDRYFERIHTRETYLLFLRKQEDISKPWYTLEVEPDGTIRQKRTEYDRQNKDLKDAEDFLKAWQKQVQKNITEDDIKLASESKDMRIKEFEEMREHNVRIRNGHLAGHSLAEVLEADLMEVESEEMKNAS